MSTNSTKTVGIGFAGLLQIAFIVLKLCKVIDWNWFVVLLPTIIPFGILLLILVIWLILVLINK